MPHESPTLSRRAWLAGAIGGLATPRESGAAPGANRREPALRSRLAWRWNAGAPLGAAPHAGADGRVAVATVEGTVQVLAPDGAHAFTWVLDGPAAVAPALGARGEVFAASSDGRVVALHPDEGLRWSVRTASPVGRLLAPPPVRAGARGEAGGPLLVLGRDGVLVMVSPRGRVVRRVSVGRPRAGPVLAEHQVLVGLAGGVLAAIDAEGRVRRERLGGRFAQDPAVAPDGTVLVVLDEDLVVLEPDTWRERFTRRGVESAAFTPGGLVVRERTEGSLLWLDRRGAVVARAPATQPAADAPSAVTARQATDASPSWLIAAEPPGHQAQGGARSEVRAAPLVALGAAAITVDQRALWAVHPRGERLRVAQGATYPWAPAVDGEQRRLVLGTASGGVEVYEVEVAPWT